MRFDAVSHFARIAAGTLLVLKEYCVRAYGFFGLLPALASFWPYSLGQEDRLGSWVLRKLLQHLS
jgi:hypothetical protein